MEFTKEAQKLALPCYEAIPKIAKAVDKKWKWEPKVGEFGIKKLKGEIVLIIDVISSIDKIFILQIKPRYGAHLNESISLVFKDEVIPILPWEVIRDILQQWNYRVKIDYEELYGIDYRCRIAHRIKPYHYICIDHCKNWQTAVMKAAIALSEEMEKKCTAKK